MIDLSGCFIGNSHMVCVKQALDMDRETNRVDPSFFFAPGLALEDLRLIDGRLVAGSELLAKLLLRNREQEIVIDQYGRFVIFGLMLSMGLCTSIYKAHRPWNATSQNPPPTSLKADGVYLVSREAAKAALRGLIRDTPAMRIARDLRRVTNRPIYLVPQPSPSESIIALDASSARSARALFKWRPLFAEALGTELYKAFVDNVYEVCAEDGLTFLEQPKDTLQGIFTRAEFGSAKVGDIRHMNWKYGAKLVEQMEATFSADEVDQGAA